MSLPILLALVVGGIAGIAILLHVMGLTAPHVFADAESAATAWEREVPEAVATNCLLSTDGHAALVVFDGGLGLVWSFGSDTVARHLPAARPKDCETGLCFTFADFGASSVTVHLNAQDRAIWRKAMETT